MVDQRSNGVISLFCGAGGMSWGFACAGAKPMLAADIDADACETYRKNLGIDAIKTDLAAPSELLLAELDRLRGAFALIGGPPCQGFSSAGTKSGDDPRNKLIFSYLWIVERAQPRWFLFENVEGLLTSHWGQSLADLVREFIRLGYCVRIEKVNFAGYGLPQARKRVIIIGNRLGVDFCLPPITHGFDAGKHKALSTGTRAPSLDEALAGLGRATQSERDVVPYSSAKPASPYDALMREGNATGSTTLHFALMSASTAETAAQLRPGQTMKDLPSELWHDSYRRRAFRRVKDGTPTERRGGAPSGLKRLVGHLNALTITSAATREFIHPHDDRPLTFREAARLQSFPDRFEFAGSPVSVARQIGNAFPPLAGVVFARALQELDGRFGSNMSAGAIANGGRLLGYKLTDSSGMSPALARAEELLADLSTGQLAFGGESCQREAAA